MSHRSDLRLVVLFVVGLAGCTRWGTTEVYGPEREVARQLLGSPSMAETKSASVAAGFAGAGTSDSAIAGLGATAGTTTLKHCVQQAELTFERSFQLQPELQRRGGDLGIAIPMGGVGAFIIASTAGMNAGGDELLPTQGYLVGGALISVAAAVLVRSFLIVPGNKPAAEPATARHRVETQLVESSGCDLPGDISERQPPVPVLRPSQGRDASARLQQLDALRAAGSISEAEYARKRQKIVDDI